jgi:signal transduction histidine kinase
MTSIKGFVDLLLMGVSGILNSEQRRYLDIVRINTNRLEILVDDLLDISRIESGRTLLVIEPISISTIFSEAEAYIHQMCKEYDKALEVEIVFTEDVPMIMGDAERVRQILENLVENSVHYTPSGGKIALKAAAVDDSVEIEVSDTGIGISLQEQNRIFERFYRGEQALNLGVAGTGLGLSIVLNLVEMHGGRIWVTSEGIPGSGTSFTVALPGADEVSQVIPETGVA